jgi:hypothetical protein
MDDLYLFEDSYNFMDVPSFCYRVPQCLQVHPVVLRKIPCLLSVRLVICFRTYVPSILKSVPCQGQTPADFSSTNSG